MRLTTILFRRKLPKGHIYRGKYRIVKPVTPESLSQLRKDFEIEERNMLLLRHPYLTVEQSHGHMSAVNNKRQAFAEKCKNLREEKFTKTVTLEERLMHLKVKDAWD